MRLLYISYNLLPGGGNYVHGRQFALALKRLNPDLVVHPPFLDPVEWGQKPSPRQPGRPRRLFGECRSIAGAFLKHRRQEKRLFEEVKPEVVVLRAGPYVSAIRHCRRMGIPLLLEINAPFLEDRFLERRYQSKLLPFWMRLEKWMLLNASLVSAVSEPLRQYYISRGVPAEKITTVPNGADTEMFNPSLSGEEVRQRLGLEGKTVIGFLGTCAAWHGVDFLFEAMSELTRQRQEIVLLLVGRTNTAYVMPPLPKQQFVWTGYVPYHEVPAHLAAMDIFVAPYPKIEPFYFSPVKLFEAMAMARPVVSSGQGQIQELIEHEKDGLLFRPGDKEAFIGHLLRLADDAELRRKLGEAARKKIESRYTWRHNAETILGLCRQIYQSA